MDRNTRLFYKGAKALNLPVTYWADISCICISLWKKNYYFYGSMLPLNKGAPLFLVSNKFFTNQVLSQAGFPTAKAVSFNQSEYTKASLIDLIGDLKFPLVVKPKSGTARGKDVRCNIKQMDVLKKYLDLMFLKYSDVHIEEFHQNMKEYRVLILKNKVIGVVERMGAAVIGDGIHSIEQLIAFENKKREQLAYEFTTSPMIIDEEYLQCLQEQDLSVDSIPAPNRKIRLCYTANTGRGGDIFSLGKKIHPMNAKYLCKVIETVGLIYAGVDILCNDINKPFNGKNWLILEVNSAADVTIHELPPQGIRINVVKKILWHLILKHPFSYIYHLYRQKKWAIYLKTAVMVGGLLIIMYYI